VVLGRAAVNHSLVLGARQVPHGEPEGLSGSAFRVPTVSQRLSLISDGSAPRWGIWREP